LLSIADSGTRYEVPHCGQAMMAGPSEAARARREAERVADDGRPVPVRDERSEARGAAGAGLAAAASEPVVGSEAVDSDSVGSEA
jgi:hypothetical protein